MSSGPVPQQPGRDDPCPAGGWPDWMDDPAYLALRAAGEDLDDPDLDDPEDAPPPEVNDGELAAEADRITSELAREAVLLASLGLAGAMAAEAAALAGRRGPGMPGSAARVRGPGAGDIGQPGGRVRVRDAAGRGTREPGAGPVRRGRRRAR